MVDIYGNMQLAADPREAGFNALYTKALDSWIAKTLARPAGIIDGDRQLAEALASGKYSKNNYIAQAWEMYKADPNSYTQRVSSGEHGAFQKDVLSFMDPSIQELPSKQDGTAPVEDHSGEERMRAFAEHMMGPVDMNDPYVQQLVKGVQASSQKGSIGQGLQGGYSVANSERNVGRAVVDAQGQRQALGLQALQSAEGIRMGDAQLAEQAYTRNWQAQMGQLQAGYESQKSQGQGVGAIIGGAIGAIPGIYTANPALISAGVSAGAGIGGGVGGMTAGPAPQMKYQSPYLKNNGGPRGGI